jgi:hypothetical protein
MWIKKAKGRNGFLIPNEAAACRIGAGSFYAQQITPTSVGLFFILNYVSIIVIIILLIINCCIFQCLFTTWHSLYLAPKHNGLHHLPRRLLSYTPHSHTLWFYTLNHLNSLCSTRPNLEGTFCPIFISS